MEGHPFYPSTFNFIKIEQASDPTVCLEVNGKATYLKESKVPASLKPFIKFDHSPSTQHTAQTSLTQDTPSMSDTLQIFAATDYSSINIKGKNKDFEFTKILKKTTFAAATPLNNIKRTNQEKISILDKFFVSNETYNMQGQKFHITKENTYYLPTLIHKNQPN